MSSTGTTAGAASWVEVAAGSAHDAADPPLAPRRVYLQVILLSCLVVAVVAVLGAVASRQVAERQAVDDASRQADVFAARMAPAITDALVAGDPAAVQRLDDVVRQLVLRPTIVRVKLWTPEGRIVYSDERRLIGQVFPLSEEDRRMLDHPSLRAEAEVSDLDAPENAYEADQGKLLEVYKPVLTTPSGRPLLFEIYGEYDAVISERTQRMWLAFGSITLFSVLALVLLLLPVLWRLLGRLSRAQGQRETALAEAVEASANERRRIAATLHDGVVQELAAASFAVSGAALRAEQEGHTQLTQSLQSASESVRGSIGALRSLLVDIYPPSLERTGLGGALRDLVAGVQSRDVEVRLTLPEQPFRLPQADERLLYRIAQEALRNALRHARATRVDLSLSVGEDVVVLEVADDGTGFDAAAVLAAPPPGHFGLRLMADAVAQGRGSLSLSTAPGTGCRWRLSVPRP